LCDWWEGGKGGGVSGVSFLMGKKERGIELYKINPNYTEEY
tara:strand:- start:760 stop:882 length:123 start_codon:yes stop_codon:yes gene_type:complete